MTTLNTAHTGGYPLLGDSQGVNCYLLGTLKAARSRKIYYIESISQRVKVTLNMILVLKVGITTESMQNT